MTDYSKMPVQLLVAEYKRQEDSQRGLIDELVKRLIAAEEAGDRVTIERIEGHAGLDEETLTLIALQRQHTAGRAA